MNKLNYIDWAALILLVIGGLNWGLIGLFGLDIVALIFKEMSVISRIIYTVVGASAIYVLAVSGSIARR